jgi:hypothetical protein
MCKASFQIKYGNFVGVTDSTPSEYQLTAAWQAGVNNASGIGSLEPYTQWLPRREIRSNACSNWCIVYHEPLHLPYLLCAESYRFDRRRDTLRVSTPHALNRIDELVLTSSKFPLGNTRHVCTCLCLRGSSNLTPHLSHFLYQHVFHYRLIHFSRCTERTGHPYR